MNKLPIWSKKIVIVVFWILLWQIGSMIINNRILLVSPIATLRELSVLIVSPAFWSSIWFSFARISLGFSLHFSQAY